MESVGRRPTSPRSKRVAVAFWREDDSPGRRAQNPAARRWALTARLLFRDEAATGRRIGVDGEKGELAGGSGDSARRTHGGQWLRSRRAAREASLCRRQRCREWPE